MTRTRTCTALAAIFLTLGGHVALAAEADVQAQINALKAVIPKFAIPMREVGDRFQDMYSAAKGGNWALAAYMSKYMNGAMTPASLTKPAEYKDWKEFYEKDFAAVNKAIQAKDWAAFDASYNGVISTCNQCHQMMEYGFIRVVKQAGPSDIGIDYTKKSEPGDVPK
jgi:hypothetical protein